MALIAVKYCGHCNAFLDMKTVLKKVKRKLPDIKFVLLNEAVSPDLLLILNACPVGCASVSDFPKEKQVFVTPDTVDRWPVQRADLIDGISFCIKERLEIKEKL